MLIGKIVGRTSPEWFQFEVSGVIKKMDFIATRDPERHWVLGRVESIIQEKDKTIAKVSVIGYSDKRGRVKAPKMPFKPGSFVYKADDGLTKRVLGLKSSGLYVGLLDGSEGLKVFVDPEKIITKHLAVLAKTGTGKSYFVGVLLEEFLENKIPAVIVDPHGEYVSLRRPNDSEEEKKYAARFEVESKGYKKDVQMFCLEKNLTEGAKKLKFDDKLTYQEVFEMLPFKLTASQLSVIYSAMSNIGKTFYTLDDIKGEVEVSRSRARWNALTVLDLIKSTGLFDGVSHVKASDIVRKGKLSVINLRGIDPDVQQLVIYKLSRDLFEARKRGDIPPFLFIIEESQNFCPERGFGEAISSRILRTIASEGRKFGMGLGVISQRPARVDKNVLSQCNTQVFLKINNPNDLKAIIDSMEGITRGLESQIKKLPVGTGVIVGLIDQPLIVNVRVRRSEHGGTAILVPEKKEEVEDELFFYPKFLEDDIKRKVRKKFEQFKLIYYPLLRLKCKFNTSQGEKIDDVFVDGLNGELTFFKDNSLRKTEGMPKLLGFKTKERAVLLYLTTYGSSTLDEMSKKLKISKKQLRKILSQFGDLGLTKFKKGKFRGSLRLNFEEIIENQISESPVNYRYSGDQLQFKIKGSFTNEILSLFNPDAVERKKCFYPFWLVFYDDGKVDVIDAITGEKDKNFVGERVFEELPL